MSKRALVAVAIGQLDEGDGHHSTVDLLASIRDGEAGGSFRFFCAEAGYYNGGVRTLSVSNGVISVTGRDYEYTMIGVIDGLVTVKEPPAER